MGVSAIAGREGGEVDIRFSLCEEERGRRRSGK